MKRWHLGLTMLCFSLLCVTFPTSARADAWDKKTVVTFPEPVEVPGAFLQPGKYVLKLVDSPSDRHIVRVLNEDENHVYATILAIPNERLEPADKTVLTFYEMPRERHQALRAWFYPGDTIGQEFAYPKKRATEIAKATNLNVPTAPAETETTSSSGGSEAETGAATASSAAPEKKETSEETNQTAQAETRTPTPSETSKPGAGSKKMPDTASKLPLLALAGLFSISAAVALRIAAKWLA